MDISSCLPLAYELHRGAEEEHEEIFAVREASRPCELGRTGEVPLSFAKSKGKDKGQII